MELITIEQARVHCRCDSDELDATVTTYANAAEAACARLANRALFPTAVARNAAIGTIATRMGNAYTAYDTAKTAAEAQSDTRVRAVALRVAEEQLDQVKLACDRDLYGIVTNDTENSEIIDAILMTLTSFYEKRAEGEVPMGAQAMMDRHLKIGPLL